MSKNVDPRRKQTEFALAALMEIPSQYRATLELGLLGRRTLDAPERIPVPPPAYVPPPVSSSKTYYCSSSFQPDATYGSYIQTPGADTTYGGYTQAPSVPTSSYWNENHACPICFTNPKDMAFGCGHQTCCECGDGLELCPICRSSIHTRIKLY